MKTTIGTGVTAMQDFDSPDFLDFSHPADADLPDGVVALFACSSVTADGCGSVAVTPEAVYLGEENGITRIDARDILSWSTHDRGALFTLTVECDDAHLTSLFSQYRAATVTAMTKTIGPERTRLRAA